MEPTCMMLSLELPKLLQRLEATRTNCRYCDCLATVSWVPVCLFNRSCAVWACQGTNYSIGTLLSGGRFLRKTPTWKILSMKLQNNRVFISGRVCCQTGHTPDLSNEERPRAHPVTTAVVSLSHNAHSAGYSDRGPTAWHSLTNLAFVAQSPKVCAGARVVYRVCFTLLYHTWMLCLDMFRV